MYFDKSHIRDDFNRHAAEYDAHAQLQQRVLKDAFNLLESHMQDGARLLDVGCGTGYARECLRGNKKLFELIGCDIAPAMLVQAAARREDSSHPFYPVGADVHHLPFKDGFIDAVLFSLVMQWMYPGLAALREVGRVMKPGSYAVVTTFGEMTLHELRSAFKKVDDAPHVSEFAPLEAVIEWAGKGGFEVLNTSTDFQQLYYGSVRELMHTIRAIGASNKSVERRRGFTGRGRFAEMENAYCEAYETERGIPASWEVIYLLLRKPAL